MASIAITMIVGAVLNATAFTGSMYLAKSLSGDSVHVDQEKIRHDKAMEKYQHDMGEYQKKRQQYQDWLTTEYTNKKIAQDELQNTDNAFKLYNQAHPDFNLNQPELSDYYKPSNKQKQYEMAYVGGGMLFTGYVASKFL